jgi:hypothetical protein
MIREQWKRTKSATRQESATMAGRPDGFSDIVRIELLKNFGHFRPLK